MTKVEELRKKLEILDNNSSAINRYEDAIYKLTTGVKLEFWLDDVPHTGLNVAGRLTREGFGAVKDAIVKDFREQIAAMTAQNKKIRKELGEHEGSL